ncbi:MAG: MATE family efflux transporter, partial [Bacteroidales bacterium]|nr:MATE family efflux transporter [Bacteroidales bacterium]
MFREYLPFYKRNLKVAIPVMLSQAGQVLVQQVDNMMVGAVGTVELAAAAFANSIFVLGLVFGMGVTFGLTPLVGHAWAQKNNKEAGELLHNSLNTNMILTVILTILMWLVSYFFDYMGQTAAVAEMSVSYYRILVISFIPFMLFFTLKQFAEGLAETKHAMYITLFANVINVVLNYALIFGKFGMPVMGLDGAGYATLIARSFMPILFLYVFIKKDKFNIYYQIAIKARPNWQRIKQLMQVGVPIATQILLEVAAFALSGIMMGWLGVVPLAAHQIALGLASVTFMVVTGIGSGTTIRVSHQYSMKDFKSMRMAANASIHMVIGIMSITAILFAVFRFQLPYMYTKDAEVIALASQLLIMAAIFQVFDGLQVVLLSILRGVADVKHSMIYALIAYIGVNIPLSYVLAFEFDMGPMGIWIGFV